MKKFEKEQTYCTITCQKYISGIDYQIYPIQYLKRYAEDKFKITWQGEIVSLQLLDTNNRIDYNCAPTSIYRFYTGLPVEIPKLFSSPHDIARHVL